MSPRGTLFQNIFFFGAALFCGIIVIHAVGRQFDFFASTPPTEKDSFRAIGSTLRDTSTPEIPNNEIAPDEPLQGDLSRPRTFSFKGYSIRELASFYARAVLLSKREYSSVDEGHKSVLAPCDFSIGWGPMSNPTVLKNFTYFQNNRFFYYASRVSFTPEADRMHSDWHVANIHLIPANERIAAAIKTIRPRDIVTVEGSLVEVLYQKQVIWKSSLSRTDSGDGACELLFLTRLSWTSQPKETETIPLPEPPANGVIPTSVDSSAKKSSSK